MLSIQSNIPQQFNGLQSALRQVVSALNDGTRSPMRETYLRIASRYLAFIRRRYLNAARGDGTWPDLAPSTKYKRLLKAQHLYKARLAEAKQGVRRSAALEKLTPGQRNIARLLTATGKATRAEQIASLVAGLHYDILIDTGAGLNSLMPGGPGNIIEVVTGGVSMGTGLGYMRHHQRGGGRLPQRQFLVPPDPQTSMEIVGEIVDTAAQLFDTALASVSQAA